MIQSEIQELVTYSDFIRQERQRRIEGIQRERTVIGREPQRRLPPPGRFDDDIIRERERDYVYEGPPRRAPPRRIGY